MADSGNENEAGIDMGPDVPNGDSDSESEASINMGPDVNGAALLEEQGMHSLQPVPGTFPSRGNATESLLISGSSDESTSSLPSHSQFIETQANTIAPQIADSFAIRSSENLPVSYQSGSHQNSLDNEVEQVITEENNEQESIDDHPSTADVLVPEDNRRQDRRPVLVVEYPYDQLDISLLGTNDEHHYGFYYNINSSEIIPHWQLEHRPLLTEANLEFSEIIRLWEMPYQYHHQQLINTLMQANGYRPNIVQRGGPVSVLRTLDSLRGCISGHPQPIRTVNEGVFLNSQNQLFPRNGYFDLGYEYFESLRFNHRTLRCHLAENEDVQFVTKEYACKDWHSEHMLIPLMFKNSILVSPLGIIWGNNVVKLFFPLQEGLTLTQLLDIHQRLTLGEVYYMTYKILQFLSLSNSLNVTHRNIDPNHLIICRQTMSLHMIGLSGICDLQNGQLWIPSNLSYHCAPALARGEEHGIRADIYSAGLTLLSALTGNFPFFETTGMQRPREYHIYSIASGRYSGITELLKMPFNPLVEILLKMIQVDPLKRSTPEELLSTYFNNKAFIPACANRSFFGPRSEVNFDGCPWINVFKPQGANMYSGDDFTGNQTNISAARYPHSIDSGRLSSEEINDSCLIVVEENGREVTLLLLPRGSYGRDVYTRVKEKLKISGAFTLKDDQCNTLQFETSLENFAEIHLTLHRDARESLRNPFECPSRESRNSRASLVQQRQQALSENESMCGEQITESRETTQRSQSMTMTGTLSSQVSNRDPKLPSERVGASNTGKDLGSSMTQSDVQKGVNVMQSPDVTNAQTPMVRSGHSCTEMLQTSTRRSRQRSIGTTALDDFDDEDFDDDEDKTEGLYSEPEKGNSMDVERSDDGEDSPTDRLSVSVNFDFSDEVSENEQDTGGLREMEDDVLHDHAEDFEEETDEELFESTVESTTGAAEETEEQEEVNSEDNQD